MTIPCQINPVLEKDNIMSSTFEVFFVASVPALGASHYTLMYGSEGSATAVVQYINHQLSRYKVSFVYAKLYIIIMHIIP